MPVDYRALEGVLYRLGERSEPQYPRPRVGPRTSTHFGPRSLSSESRKRVDVALAVERSLTAEERAVLTEHYVLGTVRHPYRVRERVVRKLQVVLDDE
jgi:hypothetical protein